jgi:glucosamine--fructose-6-phosphate aminotransferase (isomerizing)
MLGLHFESEIRQQPALWRGLARSDAPQRLAAALEGGDVCFIGSGSSLIAGELGALALVRSGLRACTLPASEAPFALEGVRGATLVAISQSGRSGDLLRALDAIASRRVVALTNDASSPLAQRADEVIELGVGIEEAIPASKSVSAAMALVLLAASQRRGTLAADAAALKQTADAVALWLGSEAADLTGPARDIAVRPNIAILGSGYGYPIARELALKFKEAAYLHAEAFAAGEFRHGSMAMLDPGHCVLAIADSTSRALLAPQLQSASELHALCLTIGAAIEPAQRIDQIEAPKPFDVLASLVAGQMLALHTGRARFVDSDAPRGLTKYVG